MEGLDDLQLFTKSWLDNSDSFDEFSDEIFDFDVLQVKKFFSEF